MNNPVGGNSPYWGQTSYKPLPEALTDVKALTASPYQGSGREITLLANTSAAQQLLEQSRRRARLVRPNAVSQSAKPSPYRTHWPRTKPLPLPLP